MGITRKLLSTCSVGLVDFRSDKERIARSTRQAAHAARAGNRAASVDRLRGMLAGQQPQTAPAGWYQDPGQIPGLLRWWDGAAWTGQTATVNRP